MLKKIIYFCCSVYLCIPHFDAFAQTCPETEDQTTCEAASGCILSDSGCRECDTGKYRTKDGTDKFVCTPCTNMPVGATWKGNGGDENHCPWEMECAAGKEWENNTCQPCASDLVAPPVTINFDGVAYEYTVNGIKRDVAPKCGSRLIYCDQDDFINWMCDGKSDRNKSGLVKHDQTMWSTPQNSYDYSKCLCNQTETIKNGLINRNCGFTTYGDLSAYGDCELVNFICDRGYCDNTPDDNTQTCTQTAINYFSPSYDSKCYKCPAGSKTNNTKNDDITACKYNNNIVFKDSSGGSFTLPDTAVGAHAFIDTMEQLNGNGMDSLQQN